MQKFGASRKMNFSEVFNNYAQGVSSVIGVLALTLGGLIGLWQYISDLRWRRTELGRQLCKAFMSDERVANATQLMEAPRRTLSKLRNEKIEDASAKEEIKKALSPNEVQANDQLYSLALTFEAFLDGLCELEHHRKVGLITEETIKSYVGYWLSFLSGGHPHRKGFIRRMQQYSLNHGFSDALLLCHNCGFDVRNPCDNKRVMIIPDPKTNS